MNNKNLLDLSIRTISGVGASATGTNQILSDAGASIVVQTFSDKTVKVASSSTSDNGSGTGAKIVRIYGVNSTYDEIYEDVTLNGNTEVSSTKLFSYIHTIDVISAGTGGTNAGIIYAGTGTFTSGVPTSIWLQILAGNGISRAGFFVVPAGYTMHAIRSDIENATATNPCTCILWYTDLVNNSKKYRFARAIPGSTTISSALEINIPQKSLVQFTGNNSTSTSTIRAYMNYRLVKNDF